jgi:hypothetical protein
VLARHASDRADATPAGCVVVTDRGGCLARAPTAAAQHALACLQTVRAQSHTADRAAGVYECLPRMSAAEAFVALLDTSGADGGAGAEELGAALRLDLAALYERAADAALQRVRGGLADGRAVLCCLPCFLDFWVGAAAAHASSTRTKSSVLLSSTASRRHLRPA